jgi:hypothetical protein
MIRASSNTDTPGADIGRRLGEFEASRDRSGDEVATEGDR